VRGNFQVTAENLLHLERRLMRVDDCERSIGRVEVGEEPARFERHRHLALKTQLLLDDDVSCGKSLRRLALFKRKIECDVVTKLRMNDGRVQRNGLQLITERRQGLPFGNHLLGRILGLGAAFGHHHRDRLALPNGGVGGHETLRRRTMAGPVKSHGDEGLASRIELGCREDRSHAGRAFRCCHIERDELGVGMWAAHKAGMQHSRQLDVVDVAAIPAEQSVEFTPWDARTNAARRWCIRRHQLLLARCAMTVSTASTMA
jgi:hypothetical protein